MAAYEFLTAQGVIVPDTAETRSEVESEWRAIFGDDILLTPESPQGGMVTAEVLARQGVARVIADVANQINPDQASNAFLDALTGFLGKPRRGATPSILRGVELRGVPGTTIPAGSRAQEEGTTVEYRTEQEVVLDATGFATVGMIAVVPGPTQTAPGALTRVASSVLGWEQVYNPNAAEPGLDEQGDVSLRRQRRDTLAYQNTSQTEAIMGAVAAIEGVRSLSFRENTAAVAKVIDGVNMLPHSVYVCVEGGEDADIAAALMRTKTCGADFNGNTVVDYEDPRSGQFYQVKFDRPEVRFLRVRVTVRPTPVDVDNLIPQAIMAYQAGDLEGEVGLGVGVDVSPFEIAGAINMVEPRVTVRRVELSEDGLTWAAVEVPVALWQRAEIQQSAIIVRVEE